MKKIAILILLLLFALSASGQKPKSASKKPAAKPAPTAQPELGSETEEFEKAVGLTGAAERIAALQQFLENFPESEKKVNAQELIVSARAELGEQKLQAGETAAGVELFKIAVQEAPSPISDKLFAQVVLGFPLNLFVRGQRGAALDVAKMIEEKSGQKAGQMLDLSKFYITIQYGTEAIRLAQKAIELEPDSPAAYQTLGVATRLNFQLEEAEKAFARALELDPESMASRQNLADLKRALGRPGEAATLYREILAVNPDDRAARAGLTLALFAAGKRSEAERELSKALDAEPKNPLLLTGAAHWYAATGDGERAVEFAQKAVDSEPGYVWAYVAMARGYMNQRLPLEAERVLLIAKQYGDFPTLDYELAAARMAAGFYREAAETLKKNFVVNEEGLIETYLGNRILADAGSFTELLSLERKVSLFEPKAADNPQTAEKLKALLEFHQKLEKAETDETEIVRAADEFVKGDDNMRLHRQLFAASNLLQKKLALPKVLELTQAAIGGVEPALGVDHPSAAVLADEIYEGRQMVMSYNQIVVIPNIPRQTLAAILRGRIEELNGWALYQQNNPAQAVVRLKRALSVLPEKSAWWRSSMWRLGSILEAEGKDQEALDAYLKSYDVNAPNQARRIVIEALYQRVNGSLEGLEAKLDARANPQTLTASRLSPTPTQNTDKVEPEPKAPPELDPATMRLPDILPIAQPEKTPEMVQPSPRDTAPPVTNGDLRTPSREIKSQPAPQDTPAAVPTPEVKTETSPAPEVRSQTSPPPEVRSETSPAPEPVRVSLTEENTEDKKRTPPETVRTGEGITTTSPAPMATPETNRSRPAVVITPDASLNSNLSPREPKPSKKKEESPTQTVTKKPEPAPEASPAPQYASVVVTEMPALNKPSGVSKPEKNEIREGTKPEKNAAQSETGGQGKGETKRRAPENVKIDTKQAANTSKSPFEPVVITVPQTEAPKNSGAKPSSENPSDARKPQEPASTRESTEKKPTEIPPTERKVFVAGSVDETRPRVVFTDALEKRVNIEEPTTCTIISSQQSISILNNGGILGFFVYLEGGGNSRQITAVPSSPADIEVILDPEIGRASGRAFFIVKSKSIKTGVYTVMFQAPCGQKEVVVKVR